MLIEYGRGVSIIQFRRQFRMHLAAYQYHFPLPILFQSPNKQALNLHIHYTVEQIKLAGTGQKPDSRY